MSLEENLQHMADIATRGGLLNLADGLRIAALQARSMAWELNTFKQRYEWRRKKLATYPSRQNGARP